MAALLNKIAADGAPAANWARTQGARTRPSPLSAPNAGEFGVLVGASSRALRELSSNDAVAGNQQARQQSSAENSAGAAYRGLGSVLLQKTLEAMLPDQAGLAASKGVAASIWKSMLAQHLADLIAPRVFQQPPESLAAGSARAPSEYPHG